MIKGKYKKRFIGFVAFLLCVNPLLSYAEHSSDSAKSEIKSESERLSQLESSKTNLESYMGDLNSQLGELSETLSKLEASQSAKEEEIEGIRQDLEAAKEQEQKQYDSMKKRIKYIYENNDLDLLSIIVGSDGMADFLNKLDFVVQISSYDRIMLAQLKEIQETIAKTEQSLLDEKEELAKLESQTVGEQNTVSAMLSKASSQLSEFDSDISSAKQQISKYEDELKRQEEALARAEQQSEEDSASEQPAEDTAPAEKKPERKENTASAKKEDTKPVENNTSSPKPSSGSGNDEKTSGNGSSPSGDSGTSSGGNQESHSNLELLAAIIECEAGGEIYEGKIAVGNVVMNRVRSSSYPNTVLGVLYQKSQFGPVSSGRFALVLARGANSSCMQAAKDVLNGKNNIGNLLYFGSPSGGVTGVIIGNHVFY